MNRFTVVLAAVAGWLTSSQTDWSSGPGFPGPSVSWDAWFESCLWLNWADPGYIRLSEYTGERFILPGTGFPGGSFSAVDIDGDLDQDIFFTQADSLWICENVDGTGRQWEKRFTCPLTTLSSYAMPKLSAADFDDDGDQDLVVAWGADSWESADWGRVYLVENVDGDGHQWLPHQVYDGTMCPSGVRMADLEGSGQVEIVVSYIDHFIWDAEPMCFCWIYWYERSGGGWIPHEEFDNWGGYGLRELLDVDLDGDLDLLMGDWITLDAFLNNGSSTWTFDFLAQLPAMITSISLGDIDSDGFQDVLFGTDNGNMGWVMNPGEPEGSWDVEIITQDAIDWACNVPADVDGDGDLDILSSGWHQIQTGQGYWEGSWWMNQGGIWAQIVLDSWNLGGQGVYKDLAGCDIDTDGLPEGVFGIGHPQGCILWLDQCSFVDCGVLTSSILDLHSEPRFDSISWTGSEPQGTSVFAQVRASDDWHGMGVWSRPLQPGSLEGILEDSLRYFQYRLTLSSSGAFTPVVEEFSLSWKPLVQEEGEVVPFGIGIDCPCRGTLLVQMRGTGAGTVELDVFDMSGRIVESCEVTMDREEMAVQFPPLPPGVYIVTASSLAGSARARTVVTE